MSLELWITASYMSHIICIKDECLSYIIDVYWIPDVHVNVVQWGAAAVPEAIPHMHTWLLGLHEADLH